MALGWGLATVVAGTAQAQPQPQPLPQPALRLAAAVELARSGDAQFAAARSAAQAGRERLPQARAAMAPNINLNASSRRNRDGSTAFDGTLGYDAEALALTLVQPLFRALNTATIAQAEWLVQLTERQLALAEQDLLLRLARSYFDVLQAQDELAAARAQKEALTFQLAQARRSFEVGTVPVTDLNEAQTRFELANAQEIAGVNDLASRQRVLQRILGLPAPAPALARLRPDVSVALLDTSAQQALVDAAPFGNVVAGIGRLAVEVAAAEVTRREAAHTPTLDLVASSGINRNVAYGSFGGNNTRQISLGLEFTMPIFQGGAAQSRIREALADRQRAADELLGAERQALLEAQQAQLGLMSGGALVEALQRALRAAETQLRSTQRGQQVGVRTRVDVLNAEQQIFATRRDLAAARYRTLLASLQLKAAAGALKDADLQAMDALLSDQL